MKSKIRWFVQSTSGLILIGTGLCMTIDAGFARHSGEEWFWYGTTSLVIFQAGLCLLVDGLRFRIKKNI